MYASMLMIGCLLLGQAETAVDEGLQIQVRRLVRQLDAPRLADREEAEAKLIAAGPSILKLLPPDSARASAEAKQRLARVRNKLQMAAAKAATNASQITLEAKGMPLSEIMAELRKQSGNEIVDLREDFGHPVTDPKLDVSLDKVPFLKALDEVLDKAELTVYPFHQSAGVGVVGRSETQKPRLGKACYDGPFRFETTSILAKRDLRDTAGEAMKVILEVAWEPRLQPISIMQRLSDLKVVDENGDPIQVDSTSVKLEVVPVEDDSTASLSLPLVLPSRDVKRIGKLTGKIEPTIPGKKELFTFDNLTEAKNVEKRLAGTKVTLEKVRRNNQIWEVRIRVGFDTPGGALESHRGWIFRNEAYLKDADGKRIPHDGMQTTRQTEDEVGIAYMFVLEKPPEKHTFVYEAPGTIATSQFEYTIEDIDLP